MVLEVPLGDLHLEAVRAEPLLDQLGLGVRPEQGLHRSVELAGELHGQGVDRGVQVQCVRHFSVPFSVVLVDRRQQGVQPAVTAFGVKPISVDPCGQPLQRRRVQMDRPALRVAGPGDQPRLLEHLNVLGHRLFRDVERGGQLVDRGRPAGQTRDHGAPDRVGERHEGAVKPGIPISITLHYQPCV